MSASLARDQNNQPVSALFPLGATSVAVSASSQQLVIPPNTSFLRVSGTANVWLEFGTAGVTATTSSLLFPGGVEVFPISSDITHVACLQVGTSAGYFSINRMR